MNLQVIKSVEGKAEYVLLPMEVYRNLQTEIKKELRREKLGSDYVSFDPADYVDNPIALARIKAGITQKALAETMGVTQAYVSKIEKQDTVSAKLLQKAKIALKKFVVAQT